MKHPDYEEKKETPAKGVKEFLASIQNNQKNKINSTTEPIKLKDVPSNPLLAIISFLESLTYTYDDGRILIQRNENRSQAKLQFLLLNPAILFSEIVKDARSVFITILFTLPSVLVFLF